MYNLYSKVEALNNKFNDDYDLKREFDNMRRFKVAPIATTVEEYEQYQNELKSYEKELEGLHIDNSNGSADAELIVVQKIDDLKRQKKELKKEKATLLRQLNDINFDQKYSEEDYAKRYSALTKFFPNVNLQEIKKLEKFHIDVVSYLKEQSDESNNEISQIVAVIDEQIEKIDKELQSCKNVETLPKEILRRYGELVTLIQEKKTAIDNYEKHQKAKADAETSKKDRDESVDKITKGLEYKINDELKALNTLVRSDLKNIAPQITINSLDSYAFFIKNDSGTGSRFKSVCLLDLVILKQTLLPAFAHDSIMFANIEPGACVDLFKLYASNVDKQTFIGVDNAKRYSDIQGSELIENNKVIQLALGDELFGQRFNKESEE